MAKRIIEHSHDEDTGVYSFTIGAETFSVDPNTLSDEVRQDIFYYGLGQLYPDRVSQETAEAKIAGMRKVHERLLAGVWRAKREGVGGGRTTDLLTAVAQVYGIEEVVAATKLAALSKETKNDLRKHPKIAEVIASIQEERAKSKRKELKKAAAEMVLPSF